MVVLSVTDLTEHGETDSACDLLLGVASRTLTTGTMKLNCGSTQKYHVHLSVVKPTAIAKRNGLKSYDSIISIAFIGILIIDCCSLGLPALVVGVSRKTGRACRFPEIGRLLLQPRMRPGLLPCLMRLGQAPAAAACAL